MFNKVYLSEKLTREMVEKKIDVDLTVDILNNYNNGEYSGVKPVQVKGLPDIDGKRIIDMTCLESWSIPLARARENLDRLEVKLNPEAFGTAKGESIVFTPDGLEALGKKLLPLTAYGILNGGSATSYVDLKKNRGFSAPLLKAVEGEFSAVAELADGRSKGITPAFINPDGTPGASYLELKMRGLLIKALRHGKRGSTAPSPLFPMFQMTSIRNDREIGDAYEKYRHSLLIEGLVEATGLDITRVLTGVQPLIAAYTHSGEGDPKFIFTRAFGEHGRVLPLPGGHGQSFFVLKDVFARLYAEGKRFVLLGNVDNLGNLPDPLSIALLALSGKPAGFEFSHKTPVDIKGGILVVDGEGRLTCADIGPAVSAEEVARQERAGKAVLFNCATGLFRLDYLTSNIDFISKKLPMRFSDQDKEAGKYSQAEQITWEVLGLMDDFLVFAVDKYERFLAAKLLLENLLTSGIGIEAVETEELKEVAAGLNGGLERLLAEEYGMKLENGRWTPRSPEELL